MKLFDKVENKFEDKEDYFILNGIKVNYKFKNDYFAKENPQPCGCPHFEFTTENKKPCLITETGYRSDFCNLDVFETFEENLRDRIEVNVNGDKKKKIKYNLELNHKEKKEENDKFILCQESEFGFEVLNNYKLKAIGLGIGIVSQSKTNQFSDEIITKEKFEEMVKSNYALNEVKWIKQEEIERVKSFCENCKESCMVDIYDYEHYGNGNVICDVCSELINSNFNGFMDRKRTPTGKIPKVKQEQLNKELIQYTL